MSEIDEIKSRLNIVDIIGQRVTLKKTGRNFKGLCPFHNEKSPSFIVSPDRQSFHCFGCGKGGSIFDFVMLYEHVDFAEALESLAERANVKLERRSSDNPQMQQKQKLFEVNHLASEYYAYLLTKHKVGTKALAYLSQRGISDKSIKTFSLGYSPNDWDGLLKYLKKKGYDNQLLETAGLVLRGNRGYYDRFRGRVMFTLKDHRGNVVGFAGRVLDPEIKEAKYINTAETPVYSKSKVLYGLDITKATIQKANEVVLMEGELDVISSYQAGIPNVVAIKGSALTEDHALLLRRFCERIVFALDADFAGDQAARRGIEIAEKIGFDMRVATMPSGKDPDEAARESPGLLKKSIKEAQALYDYFLSSAMSHFDVSTAYGKKKIADEVLSIIAKIENSIVQGHYMRKLAEAIDISEENIVDVLRAMQRKQQKKGVLEKVAGEARTRLEKTEVYVLALLLQANTKELLPKIVADDSVFPFSYPPVQRIVELIQKNAAIPPELLPIYDEASLMDLNEILDDSIRLAREVQNAHKELAMQRIKAKIATVTDGAEIANLTKKLSLLEK